MRRWIATLLMAATLAVVPAYSQEPKSETAGKKEEGGMELWKFANFIILVGILGYLLKKNGAPLLAARSREIRDGLAAGEKAAAEARAKAAAVDARLAGLEMEIAGLRDEARTGRDHEAERIKRETTNEINRMRQHATMEIESASKQARLDVQRHAARLALDLAEKKVRDRMSAPTQAGLVDRFVADLTGKAAR